MRGEFALWSFLFFKTWVHQIYKSQHRLVEHLTQTISPALQHIFINFPAVLCQPNQCKQKKLPISRIHTVSPFRCILPRSNFILAILQRPFPAWVREELEFVIVCYEWVCFTANAVSLVFAPIFTIQINFIQETIFILWKQLEKTRKRTFARTQSAPAYVVAVWVCMCLHFCFHQMTHRNQNIDVVVPTSMSRIYIRFLAHSPQCHFIC